MKHKHTPRRSHIIMFGILLVLAIGAGLLARHTLASKPVPPTYLSFNPLLEKVQKAVGPQFTEYNTKVLAWDPTNDAPDAQHVDGYEFSIAESAQTRLLITPKKPTALYDVPAPTKGTDDVTSAVAQALQSEGFTKKQQDPTTIVQPLVYTRSTDECTITVVYESVTLRCTSPALRLQQAAQAKPFVDAYLAKNTNLQAKDIAFGQVTIKSQNNSGVVTASKAAGYDLAEAVIYRTGQKEGKPSIALYYQKDDTWHFITAAGDEFGFSCQDIESNPDARKAYYDQICYDSKQGQRRMDSPRRALQ